MTLLLICQQPRQRSMELHSGQKTETTAPCRPALASLKAQILAATDKSDPIPTKSDMNVYQIADIRLG